jgi:dienelactone hydrolase
MANLSRRDNGITDLRFILVIILAAFLSAACQTVANPSVAPESAIEPHRVLFNSGNGTPLTAYLYRADTPTPGPAVVMLHGCGGLLTKSGKIKKRETAWRNILLAEGYTVLLVDSFNPRGHRNICRIKSRPVLPERERPHDTYAALQWLQSQPFVTPGRIALMGWSNGAMAMLWTIRENARQRPRDLAANFIAAVGFYPGCIKIGRTGFKSAIPALLQVGLADNWTKPKPCIALVKTSNEHGGAPMQIDAYADAAHGFDHPNSKPRAITTKNSVYRSGEKSVSVGTHPGARHKAIDRVKAYLRAKFKDPK